MSLASAQVHHDAALPPDNEPTPAQLLAEEIADSTLIKDLLSPYCDVDVMPLELSFAGKLPMSMAQLEVAFYHHDSLHEAVEDLAGRLERLAHYIRRGIQP